MANPGALPAFKSEGQGPLLLFLHGIGGNRTLFDPQLAHFGARGWRAMAWDGPGYGDSPAPARFDWAELAAAVPRLLDSLQMDQTVLVGHSMGGMLAQEVAARHGDRLRGLVLSGTSPSFGPASGDWQAKFLAERLAPLDAGRSMAHLAPELMRNMVAKGADPAAEAAATAAMAAVPEATYRGMLSMLTVFDRRDALAALSMPVLVLAGSADRVAPPVVMKRMAAAIPGSRYVVIEGAGHISNLERPAAFNAALEAFLADLPPAGF
ncbi:alpha/beta fold hydrolase [Marinibaculum pumilum]|uniref:Alpha/beta fold hydrolase n=1 Tax=Marinibaculum pumilum TaxID=1766165 RepID=A0ABV7KWZ4_9PROT